MVCLANCLNQGFPSRCQHKGSNQGSGLRASARLPPRNCLLAVPRFADQGFFGGLPQRMCPCVLSTQGSIHSRLLPKFVSGFHKALSAPRSRATVNVLAPMTATQPATAPRRGDDIDMIPFAMGLAAHYGIAIPGVQRRFPLSTRPLAAGCRAGSWPGWELRPRTSRTPWFPCSHMPVLAENPIPPEFGRDWTWIRLP